MAGFSIGWVCTELPKQNCTQTKRRVLVGLGEYICNLMLTCGQTQSKECHTVLCLEQMLEVASPRLEVHVGSSQHILECSLKLLLCNLGNFS
jgi:hypothetical protein